MVYFAFQKTADGNGESYGSEVFIMRSKDLLELHDLDKPQEATWETLPKGDKGWLLRARKFKKSPGKKSREIK